MVFKTIFVLIKMKVGVLFSGGKKCINLTYVRLYKYAIFSKVNLEKIVVIH